MFNNGELLKSLVYLLGSDGGRVVVLHGVVELLLGADLFSLLGYQEEGL